MELSDSKNIFSLNLKRIMSKQNKNQNDVIKDLEIKQSTFSDWYLGKRIPRMNVIFQLAEYFKVDIRDLIDEPKLNRGNRIPIFSKIPAGIPIELIEDVIDYEELDPKMFTGDKEYFGVKVSGDSMYPEYRDKDILIVLKTEDCESGQDCIVMINGSDGTFKRVKKTEEGIILQHILGHTDISITLNTYTSVFNSYKNEEFKKYNAYIDGLH